MDNMNDSEGSTSLSMLDDIRLIVDSFRREKAYVGLGLIPFFVIILLQFFVPNETYPNLAFTLSLTISTVFVGVFMSMSGQVFLSAAMTPLFSSIATQIYSINSKLDLMTKSQPDERVGGLNSDVEESRLFMLKVMGKIFEILEHSKRMQIVSLGLACIYFSSGLTLLITFPYMVILLHKLESVILIH